uniref:Uncharacterized protein n=1 Tax=Dulem virus 42 TaxID=3145760 RepID=A0AAU8B8N6_9CAUD
MRFIIYTVCISCDVECPAYIMKHFFWELKYIFIISNIV